MDLGECNFISLIRVNYSIIDIIIKEKITWIFNNKCFTYFISVTSQKGTMPKTLIIAFLP